MIFLSIVIGQFSSQVLDNLVSAACLEKVLQLFSITDKMDVMFKI